MSDLASASNEVLLFCVGNHAYRAAREHHFLRAIGLLPRERLLSLVDSAHLTGLFATAIDSPALLAETNSIRQALLPVLRARSIFNENIVAELTHIGSRLEQTAPDVRPVVLKGISHWGTYYDNPLERRARDLDLLIGSRTDGEAVCDVLDEEGYEGLFFVDDERTVRQHMSASGSYSAPPYRLRRRIADDLATEFRDAIRDHGADLGLEFLGPDELVIAIDVELHTGLFATETGRIVKLDPRYRRASQTLPQFDELTAGALLCYTAAKFVLDTLETLSSGSGSLKCLKLAADFVRILGQCSQQDYDDAFRIAQEWDCLHHLVDLLQSAKQLAPDLSLHGVPEHDENTSLDLILHQTLNQDAEVSLCSA